jgi:hypothetical protein
MNEKNLEEDIEGAAYREKAVARAMRECTERPQQDWAKLAEEMASPGFAQAFGALLLEKDKILSEASTPKEP